MNLPKRLEELLDNHDRRPSFQPQWKDETATAIEQDILDLIGPDEKFKNMYQWQEAEPLNLLRYELRTKLHKYIRGSDG